MNASIHVLTLDELTVFQKAKEIFDLDFDDVMYCMTHENVTFGLNRLINAAKLEGCVGQNITKNINLSMEIGAVLNLVASWMEVSIRLRLTIIQELST